MPFLAALLVDGGAGGIKLPGAVSDYFKNKNYFCRMKK